MGQSSVTIDFKPYTTKAHPYMLPVVPSASDFYLSIKTGHPIYISVTNADKGTGYFYKATSPTKVLNGDTVLIDGGDTGNWLVEYKTGGTSKSIWLKVYYQADLQDQTIGSATYGDYPDFIWVAQGGSAKVSAGPWINPTGNFTSGYTWKDVINGTVLTNSSIGNVDSIKILQTGIVRCRTNDGSLWTADTISILEKPTFNSTAKTLNFPTTLTGITYKVLKVGSINGTDTTWTETQNFVGDGNAKNITLTDGKYKLITTRGIHTAVYPYGYFVVGVTTALDKTKEENINYRLTDNNLQFDNEVNLKFYSLQGQLLQHEQGCSFKLCRQVGIFKATDKNGSVLTAKIILK
jgi:hypothetical protein